MCSEGKQQLECVYRMTKLGNKKEKTLNYPIFLAYFAQVHFNFFGCENQRVIIFEGEKKDFLCGNKKC